MALCLYENDSYAYVTHIWNAPHGDYNQIVYGTFAPLGTDSLAFTGQFSGRIARREEGKLDMGAGTDVFYEVDWVFCPPNH
jgi:hypothetical protein